jgi:hypothetical protein
MHIKKLGTSWPFAWTAFGAAWAVYLAMVLWSLPHLAVLAHGLPAFDLRPSGYSPEDAQALLEALGPEGRHWYATVQLALDGVYPGLMGLYGWLMLRLLAMRLHRFLAAAAWLPLAAATFDYLENLGIAAILGSWPAVPELLVLASAWATRLKSGCTMLGMSVLVFALCALAIQLLREKAAMRGNRSGA